MDALVRVQRGLLAEAFHAQVALERPLTGVRAHVHLQVRFATERRIADLLVRRIWEEKHNRISAWLGY